MRTLAYLGRIPHASRLIRRPPHADNRDVDATRGVSCDRCGGPNVCGELLVRIEQQRPDQGWTTTRLVRKQDFCEDCFGTLSQIVRQAAVGVADVGMLGYPVPERSSVHAHGLNCGLCRARLGDEAFGIDLVPTERHSVKRGKLRNGGAIQQHRVCFQCRTWCETVANNGAAGQTNVGRSAEGPFGAWFAGEPTDSVAVGLSERDAFVISSVALDGGRAFRLVEGGAASTSPSETLFIAASTTIRARRVLENLPSPRERARVVVVGRPDALDDAFEALRLGAGDLLVSPLSPQQVTAAYRRSQEAQSGAPRDPRSGLRIYGAELPLFGMPGNGIRVTLKSPKLLFQTALLLRRFVRGYDRVGLDQQGDLYIVAYCPADHVAIVIERLSSFLGTDAQVEATLGPTAARHAA